MKRTFEKIAGTVAVACVMMPAILTSCKKDTVQPISISLTIPSEGISIQQGETAEIPYVVNNIAEGGGNIEVTAVSGDENFTVTVVSDETGASGTISVQAPDLIFSQTSVDISVTAALASTGETASASFTVSVSMYDGYAEFSSPSNCFIAKPGSFIKFPANIGNSSEKAKFTSASLLWQDTQNLVSDIVPDPENGAVFVMLAPGTSGNAVISVTDADGNTVWSYHLWVTDFEPETAAMNWTGSATSISYKIMDRYLGALSADPQSDLSNGLFYQWGRKDPFPASNHNDELNTIYNMAGETVEKTVEQCSAENNIPNSIANPLTHYSGANSAGDWSWLTNSSSFLASDTVKDLWGGASGNKSVYDPCPDGWQVIDADAWGFVNDANTVIEIVYDSSSQTQENKDQLGRILTVGGGKFFFPSQGEVLHGGSYQNGIGSNYPCGRAWSATLNENNKPMNLGTSPSSFSFPFTSVGMGYELPVRCMKK